LADGVEGGLELGIVFALEVGQFPGQIGIGEEHFAEAHECAHDGDVHGLLSGDSHDGWQRKGGLWRSGWPRRASGGGLVGKSRSGGQGLRAWGVPRTLTPAPPPSDGRGGRIIVGA
jgi:hypothetical protein